MRAIVVTDETAGTAGMRLVVRPEPAAAINDVVVQVHASGFVGTELGWPSTWTDRLNRDRTPTIPGHELAGVVTALGYGTTGLSVGQRVFGLTDWYRDGTLAEYVAVEARNLAALPDDVDFTVGASLPISGLTAWQGLFQHGRLRSGQSVIAHGAGGAVGSMVAQLAREAGAHVASARYLPAVSRALATRPVADLRAYLRWTFLFSVRGELPAPYNRAFGDLIPALRVNWLIARNIARTRP
jgi:NADPH:quinone reductase-like Zn-dependent oxidoreductase